MRRAACLVLVVVGVLLAAWTAVIGVGKWLVIEDPLRPAAAIAILGGKMPFRAMEAAEIYRAGYAREVWLAGPEGAAEHEPMKKMGFSPYESDLYYKVLERLGVPRTAVRILHPQGVRNTREEMAAIARMLRTSGGGRVIVVTSPTHTRRVRAIWSRVAWPLDELAVRYTRHEPRELKLERWWEREEEKGMVFREVGGLLDTWLGFPMVLVGR